MYIHEKDHGSEPTASDWEYLDDLNTLDALRQDTVRVSNGEAKVGSMISCPHCRKRFKKKTYQHKFCCVKCKDHWHNNANPDRREFLRDR